MTTTHLPLPIPADSFDPKTRDVVVNYDIIEAISQHIKTTYKMPQDALECLIEQVVERLVEIGHLTVRVIDGDE